MKKTYIEPQTKAYKIDLKISILQASLTTPQVSSTTMEDDPFIGARDNTAGSEDNSSTQNNSIWGSEW